MRNAPRGGRRRRPIALVVAVALALVAVVGVVLNRASSPTPSQTNRAQIGRSDETIAAVVRGGSPNATPVPSAPTVLDGVPMGFPRTAVGAESAGVQFLLISQALVRMNDEQASRTERAMATTASADLLVADLLGKLTALRTGFPGGVVGYRIGPIASRVRLVDPDRATVEVWYVGVVSPPNLPPYEEWRTVRYSLLWERDDWRMDAERSVPGPRPVTLPGAAPSAPGELEAALDGFHPIGAAR